MLETAECRGVREANDAMSLRSHLWWNETADIVKLKTTRNRARVQFLRRSSVCAFCGAQRRRMCAAAPLKFLQPHQRRSQTS